MWLHCNHGVFSLRLLQSKYVHIWQLAVQLLLKCAQAFLFFSYLSDLWPDIGEKLIRLICRVFSSHFLPHPSTPPSPFSPIIPLMANTVFIPSNMKQEPGTFNYTSTGGCHALIDVSLLYGYLVIPLPLIRRVLVFKAHPPEVKSKIRFACNMTSNVTRCLRAVTGKSRCCVMNNSVHS